MGDSCFCQVCLVENMGQIWSSEEVEASMTSKVDSSINNSESESNTKKWKKGWVRYRTHGQMIWCPGGAGLFLFLWVYVWLVILALDIKSWVSIVLRRKENRKRRQHWRNTLIGNLRARRTLTCRFGGTKRTHHCPPGEGSLGGPRETSVGP